MKLFKTLFILGLFSLFFNCNKTSETQQPNLKEITDITEFEEGFVDISFQIVSEEKTKNSHIYIAKGLFHSKIVGLKFEVKSKMPNGINNDGSLDPKKGFIKNGIKISSIGNESDEFVKAISQLYGFTTSEKFTDSFLLPTAFSLNQSNVKLNNPSYYKFKLFFRDGEKDKEEEYCEIFFNINTTNKTIELFEKDEEYRKSLINVFTGK